MATAFLDTWHQQVPNALLEFIQLAEQNGRTELSSADLVTAILWPIHELIKQKNLAAIETLIELAEDSPRLLINTILDWGTDRLTVANRLAQQMRDRVDLNRSVAAVLYYFNQDNLINNELARYWDVDLISVSEKIDGLFVVIGGNLHIDDQITINLILPARVEISNPDNELELPPTIAEFWGRRDEFADYREQLNQSNFALIWGMSGIGKTSLATKLIEDDFGSGKVFWWSFTKNKTEITALSRSLAAFLAKHSHDDMWVTFAKADRRIQEPPSGRAVINYLLRHGTNQGLTFCFDDFQYVDESTDTCKEFHSELLKKLHDATIRRQLSLIVTSHRKPDCLHMIHSNALKGLQSKEAKQF